VAQLLQVFVVDVVQKPVDLFEPVLECHEFSWSLRASSKDLVLVNQPGQAI
jgi:hypothetical protein